VPAKARGREEGAVKVGPMGTSAFPEEWAACLTD